MNKRMISFISILLLFVLFIWVQIMQEYTKYDSLLECRDEEVSIKVCQSRKNIQIHAVILNKPDQRISKTITKIKGVEVILEPSSVPQVGDEIVVSGTLEKRLLGFYHAQYRLISQKYQVILPAERRKATSPYAWIHLVSVWSDKLHEYSNNLLPRPHNQLLAGIIFGTKFQFNSDFYDKLIQTGTVHVVAASGFNVSVIAQMFLQILGKFFRKRIALVGSMIGIIVYVMLSGANEPIVRAAIMAFIAHISMYYGKLYWAVLSLFFTTGLMLIIKPTLLFSVSLQLSFASTLGILVILPKWQKFSYKKRHAFKDTPRMFSIFREVLSSIGKLLTLDLMTSLAATIVTLPIILYYFGRVSLLSPIANLLVLWSIPPAMIIGIFSLVGYAIYPLFGKILALFVWPYLEYFIRVVEAFSRVKIGSFEELWVSPLFVLGYYLTLTSILVLKRNKIAIHE